MCYGELAVLKATFFYSKNCNLATSSKVTEQTHFANILVISVTVLYFGVQAKSIVYLNKDPSPKNHVRKTVLDQNITTLLAALLGGALSIIGGFTANYYIQSSSDRIQKKKEIRNLLEQIYKSTQDITYNYSCLMVGVLSEDVEKRIVEISDNINQIERRVNLYLTPLAQNFMEYKEEIFSNMRGAQLSKKVITNSDNNQAIELTYYNMPSIEETNKKFREPLTRMLKEKGYSYF